MTNVIQDHVTKTPGVCGGKACVAGTRIRVLDIVALHELLGVGADEIVFRHQGLGLADVYAALAYYHDNRIEIDEQMRAEEATVRDQIKNNPSILSRKLGI